METDPASHHLRHELRLRDLVLLQVLMVLGGTWPGTAARQGPAQLAFWLIGIVTFFIPLAMLVDFCARRWPEEGGVYQWVKHAAGPLAGFLAAWGFLAYTVSLLATAGVLTAACLRYALGPQAAWIEDSTGLIVALNAVLIGAMLGVNVFGLRIGKWIGHAGTVAVLGISALAVVLLVVHPDASAGRPHVAPQAPFALGLPVLSVLSLNLFTKLTFNGLGGLEQIGVFAGETEHARRNILRSAWIAAPAIAALYILITGALLEYTPAAQVDLVGPIPQLLAAAFRHSGGTGRVLVAVVNAATVIYVFGQFSMVLAEASRLPMVAAWDHLLPPAFTRLHPRHGTPVLSLICVAAVSFAFALFASGGAATAEAFQIMTCAGFLCFGVYYVLFFGVPLLAGTRFGLLPDERPGRALRLGCVSGILVTLGAMAFNLVPVEQVASPGAFAAKVAGTAALVYAVGGALYWRGLRGAGAAGAARKI